MNMKLKLLSAIFILCMLSLVFAQGTQDVTGQNVINSANSYLQQNAQNFGVSYSDLNLVNAKAKVSASESVCYWTVQYRQTYHSITVYGTSLRLCMDENAKVIESIKVPAANDPNYMVQQSLLTYPNIQLVPNINISANPAITKDAVKEILKQRYGQNIQFDETNEPVLMILDINSPKLTWYSNFLLPVGKYVFVDAQNGQILWENNNWVTDAVVGNENGSTSILVAAVIVVLIILGASYFILKSKKLK